MTTDHSQAPSALPAQRTPVEFDTDSGGLRIGPYERRIDDPSQPAQVYSAYLSLLYAVRGAQPGEKLALRSADLEALLLIVGDDPETIERRLIGLMGCSADEAKVLGGLLLRHRRMTATLGIAATLSLGAAGVATGFGDRTAPTPSVTAAAAEQGAPQGQSRESATEALDVGQPADAAPASRAGASAPTTTSILLAGLDRPAAAPAGAAAAMPADPAAPVVPQGESPGAEQAAPGGPAAAPAAPAAGAPAAGGQVPAEVPAELPEQAPGAVPAQEVPDAAPVLDGPVDLAPVAGVPAAGTSVETAPDSSTPAAAEEEVPPGTVGGGGSSSSLTGNEPDVPVVDVPVVDVPVVTPVAAAPVVTPVVTTPAPDTAGHVPGFDPEERAEDPGADEGDDGDVTPPAGGDKNVHDNRDKEKNSNNGKKPVDEETTPESPSSAGEENGSDDNNGRDDVDANNGVNVDGENQGKNAVTGRP